MNCVLGNRKTGRQLCPLGAFIGVGCADTLLARSINAPHQSSDTSMQLSRSPSVPPCGARRRHTNWHEADSLGDATTFGTYWW